MKVAIVEYAGMGSVVRARLERLGAEVEIISHEQAKAHSVSSAFQPEPIMIKARPMIDCAPYLPPMTRRERRALERKNKNK